VGHQVKSVDGSARRVGQIQRERQRKGREKCSDNRIDNSRSPHRRAEVEDIGGAQVKTVKATEDEKEEQDLSDKHQVRTVDGSSSSASSIVKNSLSLSPLEASAVKKSILKTRSKNRGGGSPGIASQSQVLRAEGSRSVGHVLERRRRWRFGVVGSRAAERTEILLVLLARDAHRKAQLEQQFDLEHVELL
jgi:hypothetical protein